MLVAAAMGGAASGGRAGQPAAARAGERDVLLRPASSIRAWTGPSPDCRGRRPSTDRSRRAGPAAQPASPAARSRTTPSAPRSSAPAGESSATGAGPDRAAARAPRGHPHPRREAAAAARSRWTGERRDLSPGARHETPRGRGRRGTWWLLIGAVTLRGRLRPVGGRARARPARRAGGRDGRAGPGAGAAAVAGAADLGVDGAGGAAPRGLARPGLGAARSGARAPCSAPGWCCPSATG